MPIKTLTLALCTLLLFACQPKEVKEQNFYYWRTTYDVSKAESESLTQNNTQKVYTRLCDITLGYDKNPHPNNVLKWDNEPDEKIEYIPVFYIENEVFGGARRSERSNREKIKVSDEYLQKLAANVIKLAKTSWSFKTLTLNEIQIDCDWSESTKENYFTFLEYINQEKGDIQLSATIRLHQIKYAESTGIPPIDKGVLMCYNMGEITSSTDENSIFSVAILKQYITQEQTYDKIPLAIALPVFKWYLAYENDNFVGIIRDIDKKDLAEDFTKVTENIYKAKRGSWKYKLKGGEIIRFEQAETYQLKEALELLKSNLPHWNEEIIYYDLNEDALQNYDKNILSLTTK